MRTRMALLMRKDDYSITADLKTPLYRWDIGDDRHPSHANILGFHVLERAFTANPGNYVIVSGYGIALVKNGMDRKGAEILEKALGLYDRDATDWNSLGVAYGKTGDLEKARAAFTKALALAPDDTLFNDNVGSFYVTVALKTKSPEAARQSVGYFEKAIAADPTLAFAYNGLGGAFRILGRNDEAIKNW